MNNTASPVTIKKQHWGVVDGKEIFLITLENKTGTKLCVSNYGGAAVSLFTKDCRGNFADVLLGYSTLNDYISDEAYMGTIVGRYANRIAGGEVMISGKKFTIHTRSGGYHLHGGETGFNKKCFDAATEETENAASVLFTYTSPDGEEGFPGNLQMRVKYTLDGEDNWQVEYSCESDKDTLINLTQHGYFNLAGHNSGNILDHELTIPAAKYLPVNSIQVPTGELALVAETPFDFKRSKKIRQHIHATDEQLLLSGGFDHSWVLKKDNSLELKEAARLYEKGSGRLLTVFTTEPAVHFYSGNFLQNVTGKNAAVYNKHAGLCLETQHYPDAPNHPNFPSTILKAGEQFISRTVFKFSCL